MYIGIGDAEVNSCIETGGDCDAGAYELLLIPRRTLADVFEPRLA